MIECDPMILAMLSLESLSARAGTRILSPTNSTAARRHEVPFEGAAIPLAEIRRRLVRRLGERQKSVVGARGRANRVVWKDELANFSVVVRRLGRDGRHGEARRLWIRIGVERRVRDGSAAGPETAAADFM